MITKEELMQHVAGAMHNPKVVLPVSTATTGVGASTYLDWFSNGLGLAASAIGVLLAFMMVRKVMAETRLREVEARLRDAELEAFRRREEEHKADVVCHTRRDDDHV